MGNQFNILDHGSISWVGNSSTKSRIDGGTSTAETILGQFTIPGLFITHGSVINLNSLFYKLNNSGTNTLSVLAYLGSVVGANRLFSRVTSAAAENCVSFDRHFYVDGNVNLLKAISIFSTTENTGTAQMNIPITLNQDVDIIFTGIVATGTVGDWVELNGFQCYIVN